MPDSTKKLLLLVTALIGAILTGYALVAFPLLLALSIPIILAAILLLKNHHLGIVAIGLFTLAGEFSRLPFGPGIGILANDVFLPLFIGIWLVKKITLDREFKPAKLFLPLLVFITIAALSLLRSLTFLSPSETLDSSLYLVRFVEYAFIYFIIIDLIKTSRTSAAYQNGLIIFGVLLAILGFAQLLIYPDFRGAMEDLGWDPHINRLLATWFDPNFVGGALTFILALSAGLLLHLKKKKTLILVGLAGLIMTAALFLTYSRSSYLALAAAIGVIGLLKSRKLLLAALITALILVSISTRAQERVVNMYHSAAALFNSQSIENPDATARLRVESWQNAWEIVKKRPILGSGYNSFKYVQIQEGLLKNPSRHSASGSDSSLLNILATTGILGLLPFLAIFLTVLHQSFTRWRDQKLSPRVRGFSLGLIGGIAGLLIHGIFVNSLLFPFIMTIMWSAFAVMESQKSRQ